MIDDLINLLDALDLKFKEVRRAAEEMAILMLSTRMMLIDKGICTQDELLKKDECARFLLEPEFKNIEGR